MEKMQEFLFCEMRNGRPVVLRRDKIKNLPAGSALQELRLSPEEYGEQFHPEECLPKALVLPEAATLTELWQRCCPGLEQLVKEASPVFKEFRQFVEFQKRIAEWPRRIRNQMATSSNRSNAVWVAQAAELLKVVVRFQRRSERLASCKRCPERDARWDDVQRLADEVVATEAALSVVEGSIAEKGSREHVTVEGQAGDDRCRRKRGRPRGPAGDPKLRKRVCDAWKSGRYKTKRKLAEAFLRDLVEEPGSPEQHEAALRKAERMVRLMIDSGRKSGDLGNK